MWYSEEQMTAMIQTLLFTTSLWLAMPAQAAPQLGTYASQMAHSMQQVIDGTSFSEAFPWPLETASNHWESGFRGHLKAIEPVRARTGAIAMNWTFFKAGQPQYVVQLVMIPTQSGASLMRLHKVWSATESRYPDHMVSTQGRPPNQWPDRFRPWAKVLSAYQHSAMPNECSGLPLAKPTQLKAIVPAPYLAAHSQTLKNLSPLVRELCQQAYSADSATLMPVRQHFNLVNTDGQIRGGVLMEFKAGANGLVLTNPQFKQIESP
jgi:hypothetical protein